METTPATFIDFLKLIGSPVFLGILVSVVLTKWAWFVNLTSKVKFWIVGGICIGLPILSQLGLEYLPQAVVAFLEHWYPIVVVGMGVWATATGWNKLFGVNGAISRDTTVKDAVKATKAKG